MLRCEQAEWRGLQEQVLAASLVRAGVRPSVLGVELVRHFYHEFNQLADALASGR